MNMKTLKKKHLFWDVEDVDPKKYPKFVIERILEYGDEQDVRWMLKNFNRSQIKRVLSGRRGLSSRSANYWSLVFNVPKNKILCLNRSYQKMRKSHWPY
jgi:hypothetical protein